MKVLAFDIGISSIGWALVESGELKDTGVRIFTKAENPKTGESLALPRRTARGVRRRLNRRKVRLNELKRLICAEFGLNLGDFMSSDGELPRAYATSKETKSPYQLRFESLERKLTADELTRVILHIAKHRGYGNKHAKESNDDDSGKVKKAIAQNAKLMGEKTAGQYLYELHSQGKKVRNKKDSYEMCIAQGELQKELELIFEKQRKFSFAFSDKKYKIYDENRKIKELDFQSAVIEIAFLQRPLKSFDDKVGKCKFFADEFRAAKDSPSAIEFVALGQIINTLRNLEKESLKKKYGEVYGKEKVQEILKIVLSSGKITYAKLRNILGLPTNIYFPKGKNLDYKKGNIITQIKALLYKISKKVNPKEKECIYSKDQEMQIYEIVRESGGISYAKLREFLNIPANIKFDNALLGKRKGLDYTKDNVESTIKEMKEKDPESSTFLNFENLIKFKNAFEPKKNKKQSSDEDLEDSEEMESNSGIFATLLENHKNELDLIAQEIANEKDKMRLRSKLETYAILKGKNEWLDELSELNFSKRINLSLKALEKILPYMHEGMLYNEAVEKAQNEKQNPLPKIKDKEKEKFLPPLKDYEPYLANPVVARALSEYRKVCNALLDKYGKVHKIHIELGREVGKSYSTRQQYEKDQKENLRKINEAKERLKQYGISQTPQNILKARLFIEQGECCVYSKAKITKEHLDDPKALEIDHIYPYSRSFDDSYMNKVLVFSKENQNKRNQTPFEAFGANKEKWEMIKSFAKNFLPHQKYKRIINENFADKENEFKDRNLNDTRYMAKLALDYTKDNLEFEKLSENECTISGEKNSKVHCEAVSGTLTTNLRRIWGFEDKNRDNHLHHALDAIIIAHINASMIKQFSEYYKDKNELKIAHYKKRDRLRWQLRNNEISKDEYNKQDEASINEYISQKEKLKQERLKDKFCLPYGDFRKVVEERMSQIFVSKPPRKRARGALHEKTFGSICEKNGEWVAKIKRLKEDKDNTNKEKYEILYRGEENIKNAFKWGKIRKIQNKNSKTNQLADKDEIKIGDTFAKNDKIIRTDIFKRVIKGKKDKVEYYAVPIYRMDYALGILPNDACPTSVTDNKTKNLTEWIPMDSKYTFCFSLFTNDLVRVKKKKTDKKGMENPVIGYYEGINPSNSSITIAKHDNYSQEDDLSDLSADEREIFKRKVDKNTGKVEIIGEGVGIRNLEVFEKWQVSVLGEVKKAKFKERKNIALKFTPKISQKGRQNEL